MTTAAEKTSFTPEELLLLPDSVNYELVNGNLVERQMGSESSAIAMAIGIILGMYVRAKKLGHLFMADCSYECFADDKLKVRKPDVSFIKMGRLADEQVPEGHLRIPPDLPVEVLSPGDTAYEVETKVQEYLDAGVRLVWVVNPRTRTLRIHRPKESQLRPIDELSEKDRVSGEDVVVGFECAVADFFKV